MHCGCAHIHICAWSQSFGVGNNCWLRDSITGAPSYDVESADSAPDTGALVNLDDAPRPSQCPVVVSGPTSSVQPPVPSAAGPCPRAQRSQQEPLDVIQWLAAADAAGWRVDLNEEATKTSWDLNVLAGEATRENLQAMDVNDTCWAKQGSLSCQGNY